MKVESYWTIGGDFLVMDKGEDGPLIELKFHGRIRDSVRDPEMLNSIIEDITTAILNAEHPYPISDEERA